MDVAILFASINSQLRTLQNTEEVKTITSANGKLKTQTEITSVSSNSKNTAKITRLQN